MVGLFLGSLGFFSCVLIRLPFIKFMIAFYKAAMEQSNWGRIICVFGSQLLFYTLVLYFRHDSVIGCEDCKWAVGKQGLRYCPSNLELDAVRRSKKELDSI